MDTATYANASISGQAFSAPLSIRGAVCGNSARTDLCGGYTRKGVLYCD